MTRFFVTPEEFQPDFIALTGENAKHAKVLRLKNGEEVLVCDGQGRECLCTVSDVSDGQIGLVVKHRQNSETEASVRVSVYMAFPKADKLEHVIQKATELGAYEIVAFLSARCVSRPDDKSLKKKLERWQKIARSAAEQSGRGLIPRVEDVISIDEAIERMTHVPMSFVCYEKEENRTLADLSVAEEISFLIGSEGGLADEECTQWQRLGIPSVSLGERILRTENAAAYVLPVLFYKSKNFKELILNFYSLSVTIKI